MRVFTVLFYWQDDGSTTFEACEPNVNVFATLHAARKHAMQAVSENYNDVDEEYADLVASLHGDIEAWDGGDALTVEIDSQYRVRLESHDLA